ncbi:neprilysin-3-like [Musca autumnalis]|uniref:neprilysin-3-like n=1 Tax=Musca autumnalis TaxID=221902 RepID=UPI003CE8652F
MWKIISIIILILHLSRAIPPPTSASYNSLPHFRHHKSEEIRKYMNVTADPCENFYEFACGNWRKYYPANADETQRDAFTEASKAFRHKLGKLLTIEDFQDFNEAEMKLKNVYGSCMSLQNLPQREYNSKLKQIAKEFGGMPLLEGDAWQEQEFDWQKTIAEISKKYGLNIIVGYAIMPKSSDPSKNEITIKAQDFTIQNDFNEHREVYREEVLKTLKTHLNVNDAMGLQVAQEIVDFEMKLWNAKAKDSNAGSDPLTIDELQMKFAPDFDVHQFMTIAFGSIPQSLKVDITVYLKNLIDIIKTTPKRVVANYIFYNLLNPFQFQIPSRPSELEDACYMIIQDHLPKIISHLYYRKYDLGRYESTVYSMWNSIKATIKTALESPKMYWYDNKFRQFALEKLQTMEMVIPSYQGSNLIEEYKTLTTSINDFAVNLKSLLMFKAKQMRNSLHETTPQLVELGLDMFSPGYVRMANKVVVPVSALDNTFFYSVYNSHNLNDAHLGFLLAHEIMHAYTGVGRYFDSMGRLIGESDIEEEFVKRQECLYNQYRNYTYGGRHLPQDETQNENAADNAGILMAYKTYRSWYEKAERISPRILIFEKLPNLTYDATQLFFIYYAQMWCSDTFESNNSLNAAVDEHVPDAFRAFVPLTNLDEFSQAFECAKGTPMNPSVKCEQMLLL